ncbi:hypothetical protein FB566_2212 [Stackebrandtia endophytica]|uniref:Uncharacterized protein n=1 Tax=Stackebrandtia endophytica TaxID=1496996 RepID=A0A543AVS4_9ACTN|nr:hypothetical protein [Stackebrandtia endophytica]TQL76677.1 hypothetical protein FB566_2212 [Stackebrandtia endophytica]
MSFHRFAPPVLSSVAALYWVLALTWLQPLTDPGRPWHDWVVGNNSYWVRELRWAMIVLMLACFVWACRGDLKRTGYGAVTAGAWIGADVWLDRLNVTGVPTTIALSIVAVSVVVAARRFAVGSSRPRPKVLTVAAIATATLAGHLTLVRSPFEDELFATLAGAVVAGVLAIMIALGCASSVRRHQRRTVPLFTVAYLVSAVAVVFLASGGAELLGSMLLTTAAQLVVVRLVSTTPFTVIGCVSAGIVVAAFNLGLTLFFAITGMFLEVGRLFTTWAGNPPINAADSDILYTAIAVVVGAMLGYAYVRLARFLPPVNASRGHDRMPTAA